MNITEDRSMPRDKTKEELFETIYREYYHDVYRISLYYTKNEHEAEDITQKVFYKLYQHLEYVKVEYVKGYLFRIARNLSYNWLRDTKREREGFGGNTVSRERCVLPDPEECLVYCEELRAKGDFFSVMMLRLQQENEMWYDILNFIYCLEMTHDDAAKVLGISKSVLYSKLYRAKKWLHKTYKEEYERCTK